MWRWVGIACLVYGLSSLSLMFAPRPPGPENAAPGAGTMLGPPELPSAIDFEGPLPPLITRPQSETVVVEHSSGNHVLEWRLPPEAPGAHTLVLPMRPPPGSSSLVLELGANREQALRIGVHEQDGSLYLVPLKAVMAPIEQRIPLAELRQGEMAQDENGRLDPAQVMGVAVICPELRAVRNRRMPAVITLDNLRFE